jgi:TPR repeat protein
LAALALGSAAFGCRRSDDQVARAGLEEEGFSEISLVAEGPGNRLVYDVRQGDYRCQSTVRTWRHAGARSTSARHVCRLDEGLCQGGRADVCVELAEMHDRGEPDSEDPVVADAARANSLYARACEQGHGAACNTLGLRAAAGTGMPSDRPRAAHLFAEACHAGCAAGCLNLASCSAPADGVPGRSPQVW